MIYTNVMNIPVEKEKGILSGSLQSGFNYLGNVQFLEKKICGKHSQILGSDKPGG